MNIESINKFMKDTSRLAYSIVFKLDILGKYIELKQLPKYELGTSISPDRYTWKYYLNLSGKYHRNDEYIYIKTIDDGVTILLNRANIEKYPLTKRELLKRDAGTYSSIYSDNMIFINGVLSTMTIDELISSSDFKILGYDSLLLEENEKYIISQLEVYIKNVYKTHINEKFALYHDNYLPLFMANAYNGISLKIVNLRASKINTIYAHSYLVDMKLKSNKELSEEYMYLSKYSRQWLYLNIGYLNKELGSRKSFDMIVDNLIHSSGYDISNVTLMKEQNNITGSDEPYNPVIRLTDITNKENRSISVDEFTKLLYVNSTNKNDWTLNKFKSDIELLFRRTPHIQTGTSYLLLEKTREISFTDSIILSTFDVIEYIIWSLLSNRIKFTVNIFSTETSESILVSNNEELLAILLYTLHKSGRIPDLSTVTGINMRNRINKDLSSVLDYISKLPIYVKDIVAPLINNIPMANIDFMERSQMESNIEEYRLFNIFTKVLIYTEPNTYIKDVLIKITKLIFTPIELLFDNGNSADVLINKYEIKSKILNDMTDPNVFLIDIIHAILGDKFSPNKDIKELGAIKSMLDKLTSYLTKILINSSHKLVSIPTPGSLLLSGNTEAKILDATSTLTLPPIDFTFNIEIKNTILPTEMMSTTTETTSSSPYNITTVYPNYNTMGNDTIGRRIIGYDKNGNPIYDSDEADMRYMDPSSFIYPMANDGKIVISRVVTMSDYDNTMLYIPVRQEKTSDMSTLRHGIYGGISDTDTIMRIGYGTLEFDYCTYIPYDHIPIYTTYRISEWGRMVSSGSSKYSIPIHLYGYAEPIYVDKSDDSIIKIISRSELRSSMYTYDGGTIRIGSPLISNFCGTSSGNDPQELSNELGNGFSILSRSRHSYMADGTVINGTIYSTTTTSTGNIFSGSEILAVNTPNVNLEHSVTMRRTMVIGTDYQDVVSDNLGPVTHLVGTTNNGIPLSKDLPTIVYILDENDTYEASLTTDMASMSIGKNNLFRNKISDTKHYTMLDSYIRDIKTDNNVVVDLTMTLSGTKDNFNKKDDMDLLFTGSYVIARDGGILTEDIQIESTLLNIANEGNVYNDNDSIIDDSDIFIGPPMLII